MRTWVVVFLAALFIHTALSAQQGITAINFTWVDVNNSANDYTATSPNNAGQDIDDNTTYEIRFSSSTTTDNNRLLSSFTVGGVNYPFLLEPDTLALRRVGTASRLSLWIEAESIDNTGDILTLNPERQVPERTLYQASLLNIGYDNVLVNSGTNSSNIERIDAIYRTGMLTAAPANALIPVLDRGANAEFKIAAILSLDANGDPATFGSLLEVEAGDSGGEVLSIGSSVLFLQQSLGQDPIPTGSSTQGVGGVAISLAELGVAANQIIYGYSLFSIDVNAVDHDLADISTFPTNSSNSGLDFGAGAVSAVSSDNALIKATGPGGYKSALSTWLKANAGVTTATDNATVTDWQDQSLGNHDATTLITAPNYRDGSNSGLEDINFNPTVDFLDASETGLQIANNSDYNVGGAPYTNKSFNMAIRTGNNITTKQQLYEQGDDTRGIDMYIESGNLVVTAYNTADDSGSGVSSPWNNGMSTTTISTALATETEYIITFEMDGSASGTGTVTAYLNGQTFGNFGSVGQLADHSDQIGLGDFNSQTVTPAPTECPVTTVVSSTGVDDANEIIGSPDGAFAQVYSDGDIITVDFGEEYPSGTTYSITWRRRSGQSGNAIPIIRESTASSFLSFTEVTPLSTASETFQTDVVTSSQAFRYIQITKDIGTTGSQTDFDLDAIVVDCSGSCPVPSSGGIESESGITNSGNITGLPDGAFAEVYTDNDVITVDFGEEYASGTTYELTWRRKTAATSGTAIPIIRESTLSDVSVFTQKTPVTSTSSSFQTDVITSSQAFRYIQITKNGTTTGSQIDFDLDAIVVNCSEDEITFSQGDAASFYGSIPEFIYCSEPSSFTSSQRNRIESYLALKYGVTLDQSSPINYVNSAGDIIFNTTNNASIGGYLEYNNDIAGIGRDDASEFLQTQSQSENNNSLVRINRSAGIAVDDTWLIWGNDGASATTTNSSDKPPLISQRINRVWRVAEEGSMGQTDISFDITDLGFGTDPADFSLLVAGNATNGVFTSADVTTGGTTSVIDGRTFLTFSNIDLADGEYFSLGTGFTNCGPGGVSTDLYVWLKPDIGTSTTTDNTTLTTWTNQASGGPDATSDGAPPLFKNNSTDNINFVATVDFDGSDDRLSLGSLTNIKSGATNGGDYTLIGVGLRQSSGNTQYVIGSEGGTSNQDLHFGYRNNTTATIAHWGNDLDVTVNAFDSPSDPFILLAEYDGSTRSIEEIRGGGFVRNSESESVDLSGTKTNYIGDVESLDHFNGLISEVIIFDNDITDLQKEQIYTYLSIKYGITLTNNLDNDGNTGETISGSVTEGDYVLSDGSTIVWDFSANSAYHNGVAGIGRDDDACLNQRQSGSEEDGNIVSMGLGSIAATNSANANSFTTDKDFMVWGNDGTAASNTQSSDVPGTVTERLSRIWKVQETGTVGATQLSFDLTGLGLSSNSSDFQLITSTSSTMASGTTISGGTFDGNVLTFNNVDFNDGDFFTLGTARTTCGPGGITTSLALWLRADAGTNTTTNGAAVTSWFDQSSNSNNATEQNAGGGSPVQPLFVTNDINSNPAIRFTNSENTNNSWLETGSNSSSQNLSIISVFKSGQSDGSATDFTESPSIVSTETGAATDDWALGMSEGRVYVNATTDNAFSVRPVTNYADNTARIATATRVDATNGSGINLYINSENVGSAASNGTDLDAAGSITIGNHSGYDQQGQFDGDVAEVIVFDQVLSETDQAQVESYLAVKYGITRNISGLSEAAEDYLSGDGAVVWDIDNQGLTYHNDIFGIGRDDSGCFLQEESKSINSDALVTIGVTTAIATDDSYLLSGNDNASIEAADNNERPAGINSRLNREWRVQETGTIDNVQVTYDVSTITGPLGVGTNNLNLLRLLVDDDGDFSSGATIITPTSIDAVNNTVTFVNNFNSGQYYTLGSTENAALPVTLISFSAQAKDNGQVALNWTTVSEVNNSFFTIERSTDGISFEAIGTREGAGDSEDILNYEFTDPYPAEGANFYRLKQTDFNGEFEYSEILRVIVNRPKEDISYKLYPNPIGKNDELKIQISGGFAADRVLHFEVVSLNGRPLSKGELKVAMNQARIKIGQWTSGLYLLRISSPGYKPEILRFMIR